MRIGLMGGTFNPIHVGHLIAAQEAMVDQSLEEVLFVPNRVAPHRSSADVAPAEDRWVMTCMAIMGNDRFLASRIELESERPSYSYETVKSLRRLRPDCSFTFITGADSLLRDRWRYLDELLGLLDRFVIVSRPGFDLGELERRLDEMGLEHRDRLRPLPIPEIDVSSTTIRRRIREGRPIRYMVPDAVEDYVRKYGLYR